MEIFLTIGMGFSVLIFVTALVAVLQFFGFMTFMLIGVDEKYKYFMLPAGTMVVAVILGVFYLVGSLWT